MVLGSPICEKPLASAPTMPSSLTQRCNSLRGEVGVLQRQRGQRLEAVRPLAHLLGEIVVGLARDLVGLLGIGDGLDRRRVQRQDHHLHAELVHQPQPPAMQVEDALAHLDPDVVGKESLGIVQRVVDREMLFEPDLALHGRSSPFRGNPIRIRRKNESHLHMAHFGGRNAELVQASPRMRMVRHARRGPVGLRKSMYVALNGRSANR